MRYEDMTALLQNEEIFSFLILYVLLFCLVSKVILSAVVEKIISLW